MKWFAGSWSSARVRALRRLTARECGIINWAWAYTCICAHVTAQRVSNVMDRFYLVSRRHFSPSSSKYGRYAHAAVTKPQIYACFTLWVSAVARLINFCAHTYTSDVSTLAAPFMWWHPFRIQTSWIALCSHCKYYIWIVSTKKQKMWSFK